MMDLISERILNKPTNQELTYLEVIYLSIMRNEEEKKRLINKIKKLKKTIDKFWEFNPTEDKELEDLRHYSRTKLTDLENMKYEIMYNELPSIDDFIYEMNIPSDEINLEDGGEKSYKDLSEKIKNKWEEFIDGYRLFPL